MTNAVIDNSVGGQNVVLWQYDKAAKFCAAVEHIEAQAKGATEAFWDYFAEKVHGLFAAESADDYGLALWGVFVGMGRPQLTVGGVTQAMSAELYRKVLGARIRLLMTSGTLGDILQYVSAIFGEETVKVEDLGGMAIEYGLVAETALDGEGQEELKALYALGDYWQYFPAGVRDNAMPDAKFFAFKGQHAAQTGAKITSGFGRSVFHPKTRTWRFLDDAGREVDVALSTQVESTVVDEEASIEVSGEPDEDDTITVEFGGAYSISGPEVVRTTGTVQDEVTWTLKLGSWASAKTATQTGRKASVWSDYGVYFPKGSGMGGTFPSEGITARWG